MPTCPGCLRLSGLMPVVPVAFTVCFPLPQALSLDGESHGRPHCMGPNASPRADAMGMTHSGRNLHPYCRQHRSRLWVGTGARSRVRHVAMSQHRRCTGSDIMGQNVTQTTDRAAAPVSYQLTFRPRKLLSVAQLQMRSNDMAVTEWE